MKYNWNIDQEERNRILKLHESATKNHYLIKEQVEYESTTDPKKVPHAFLSDTWGLPNGAQNENAIYKASMSQIFAAAKNKPQNQFLSVFQVSKQEKEYRDYLQVGDQIMDGAGTKVFNIGVSKCYKKDQQGERFEGDCGIVLASHNGLLGIARLMTKIKERTQKGDDLTKLDGYWTFTLQSKDRKSEVVNVSQNAYNLRMVIKTIIEWLSVLPIQPQNRKNLLGKPFITSKSDDEIASDVLKMYTNLSIGLGYFLNANQKDAAIKEAGLVQANNAGLDKIITDLKNLQKQADYVDGNINNFKRGEVKKIEQELNKILNDQFKPTYIDNFKKYMTKYLPNTKLEQLPQGNQDSLEQTYTLAFSQKPPSGSTAGNPSRQVTSQQHRVGY